MVFALSKRTKISGIDVGVLGSKGNVDSTNFDCMQTKLKAALDLMRIHDPRRFAYLQRDVRRILVLGSPGYQGAWHQAYTLCELTTTYVLAPETTPALLASTFAHEAMHARLHHWGFGYEEAQRVRVERICFKASSAFARRLPTTEGKSRAIILHNTELQLQRDPVFWTDQSMIEEKRKAFRELGCPDWMIALLQRWIRPPKRRPQPSRKRRS